jgi:hypothetical protein
MTYVDDYFIAEFEEVSSAIEDVLEDTSFEMRRDVLCVLMVDAVYDDALSKEEALKKFEEWSNTMKESLSLMYEQAEAISKFERETGLKAFLNRDKS